ncbi:MAG: PfkB family carbohydrate kinase [Hyphomicrobiales bacterium]
MRAYVVGNVAMDETFEVEALPQEGQSILGTQRSSELGGKGANQAIVLARCGVPVTFIGGIGNDAQAEKLRARMAQEPVDARFVTLPGKATDLSIVMAGPDGGNAILTTVDCARTLDVSTVMPVLHESSPGDVMVLQGNLSAHVTAELFDVAAARDLKVVFNPSPVDEAFRPLIGRASMVFLNEAEAETYTDKTANDAVRALLEMGSGTVVLTRGSQGALLGLSSGAIEGIPAQNCDVVDTTGAGDTFQSVALASAMLSGGSVSRQALQSAAKAAAITISRFGTVSAMPGKADLSSLLSSHV